MSWNDVCPDLICKEIGAQLECGCNITLLEVEWANPPITWMLIICAITWMGQYWPKKGIVNKVKKTWIVKMVVSKQNAEPTGNV